jgi:hypothetical protein
LRLGRIIVGGDGAALVKEGAELFGGLYELSKSHLKRALLRAMDNELAKEVYQSCVKRRS